jgi:hypothetical protein
MFVYGLSVKLLFRAAERINWWKFRHIYQSSLLIRSTCEVRIPCNFRNALFNVFLMCCFVIVVESRTEREKQSRTLGSFLSEKE